MDPFEGRDQVIAPGQHGIRGVAPVGPDTVVRTGYALAISAQMDRLRGTRGLSLPVVED
jgi:hypothetical protein